MFRYREGEASAGGEQVARDEQGVLHGHYARSCPSRNPDPARTLCSIPVALGFIQRREREREITPRRERVTTIYISGNRSNPYAYGRVRTNHPYWSSTSCFRDVMKFFIGTMIALWLKLSSFSIDCICMCVWMWNTFTLYIFSFLPCLICQWY